MNPLTKIARPTLKRKWPFPKMREVIEFAESNTIALTVEKFGVSHGSVENWIKEKDFIFKMSDPLVLEAAIQKRDATIKERERIRKMYWHQRNPPDKEKQNAKAKRWYHQNKELIAARVGKMLRGHILRKRANVANANARTNGAEGKITASNLWRIARKQRLICPLSGMKLTAENCSVDHKLPFSCGGTNNPDNIRLVHLWVNKMRLHFPDEEFITMCRRIADFNPSVASVEIPDGHK